MVGPPNPFVFQRFQLHWLCSNWLLYILIMLYGDEKTLSGRWTYEVCLMWLWCLPWWIRCTHAHQQEKGTWHWISMFKLTWWSFIHSIMWMVLWNLPFPRFNACFHRVVLKWTRSQSTGGNSMVPSNARRPYRLMHFSTITTTTWPLDRTWFCIYIYTYKSTHIYICSSIDI